MTILIRPVVKCVCFTFHETNLPRYVSEPLMNMTNVICSRSQLNVYLVHGETYVIVAVVAKTDQIVTCCIHCVDIIKMSY